jgi:hypothetical protein
MHDGTANKPHRQWFVFLFFTTAAKFFTAESAGSWTSLKRWMFSRYPARLTSLSETRLIQLDH